MATDEPEPSDGGRLELFVVFALVAAAVLVYALRGGTYDVVARGEAGALVWWLLALGLVAGVLPRARPSRPAWVALAGLAALAVWTLLAFGWTESDERTSVELARVLHHLGVLLLLVCALRRRTAPAAVAGATLAAAVVCLLAVGSRLYPGAFPADAVKANFGGNRLNYPLNYWNAVAAWGAMATAMCLAWSAHARGWWWRAAALAAVPVCVTAVYLTYSRAGVAGVALGAVLVVVAARTRLVVLAHAAVAAGASWLAIHAVRGHEPLVQATGTTGRGSVVAMLVLGAALCAIVAGGLAALGADRRLAVPRRPATVAALAGAVVAVVVGAIVLPPVVRDGWQEFKGERQARVDETSDPAARFASLNGNRYALFDSALRAWRSDKPNGTGPGTFEFWWNRDAVNAENVRDAHSLYLEALAEAGWPGLLCVLVLCAGAAAAVVRARLRARSPAETGAAVAALAAAGLFGFHAGVDWMWEETAVTVLALVAIAAAAMAGQPDRGARPRLALRVPGAVACLVVLLAGLPPLVGTSRVRESQRAFRAGDLSRARAAAEDAASAWPWAAAPLVQCALLAESTGALGPALADARRAARREPGNWRHPLLIARLEARRDDPQAALAAFRRAKALRPLSAVFR